ncbi:calcium-activated chloride channel regulator family member 3-like [Ptychodera flava]|uniref:calcium-activated chloride channel regulator family member 3-like n=1 Tax=Ptychodera flava TaxID=63121 RepID=UPI00396A2C5D
MHLNATVVIIIAACISPLVVWGGLLPRSRISLVNNEYRGILIAIGEDVPENASLLERLQEIFTNASKSLYRATNKRAFFKEVTILIPKTWSDGIANIPATRQVFDAANVIVTEHEGVGRETPYTNQFGSCGEEAEYIHLTDKFILDEEWTQYYYGDPGKVIVHMWGHLRWGLFDEFARKDDEHFYLDENGNVEPTRCSKSIRGVEYDSETWKACGEDPERNNLPNKHCRFTPFLHNNEGTGSYMFGGFVDSVDEFCHSNVTGDPTSLHNAMAPTNRTYSVHTGVPGT